MHLYDRDLVARGMRFMREARVRAAAPRMQINRAMSLTTTAVKTTLAPGPEPGHGQGASHVTGSRRPWRKFRLSAAPPEFEDSVRLLGPKARSVRFRVLATMLVLMCAGLALAGFITYGLEFRDLDSRVDQALLDRTRQIHKLIAHPEPNSAPSASGEAGRAVARVKDAVDEIETSRHEVIAVLIDGRVAWKFEGEPETSLLRKDRYDVATALASLDHPVLGELAAGQPLRIAVSPLGGGKDATTVLMVGKTNEDQRERVIASLWTYTSVSAATLAVSGAVGGLLAGRLLGPLRRLREATEIVSHKDLSRRVAVRSGVDDVAQLARTFNTMMQRLDDGVREQQQFMDDASHELRTPLTIIRGHLELMSVLDPADIAGTRDLVLEETDRMQRLVDDLLLLAHSRQPDFVRRESIHLVDFTAHVMEKIRVLADRHWQIDETAGAVISADPQRLTQALVQLAANAVRYTDPSSTIAVGTRIDYPAMPAESPLAGRPVFALWMRDTGSGIAAEDQGHIFDRFARAVPGRGQEGSGLGLAIVSAIAEAHGGHVSLASERGRGSTFCLHLPMSGPEPAS